MKQPVAQSYIPFQNHLPRLYLGAVVLQLLHVIFLIIARQQELIPPAMMNHLIAISTFIILIGFANHFYHKNLVGLSITLFLIGALTVTSSQVWYGNGLNDPAIVALPGIVMLAALLGNFRNFVTVLIVALLVTFFIGIGSIYGWVPHNKNVSSMDVVGLISIIILSGLAIGWYAKDFKRAIHNIDEENKCFRESEDAIFHLAHHDALTNLLTVPTCQARYVESLKQLNAERHVLIFIFIDLDNFKQVNDTYSHNAGDQLLMEMSRRMKLVCEDEDLACRLGGDEFILICKRTKSYSVDLLANELLGNLTQDFRIKGVNLEVSASGV